MLRKLCLGAAALVLGLSFSGAAQAHGPNRPGPYRPQGSFYGPRPYYAQYGTRYNGGYYYRGQNHDHWGHRVWNARYGRHHYWDPHLRCNYYWSAPRNCYLPVDGPCPF